MLKFFRVSTIGRVYLVCEEIELSYYSNSVTVAKFSTSVSDMVGTIASVYSQMRVLNISVSC